MKTKILLTVVITFLFGSLLKIKGQCVKTPPVVMVNGATFSTPAVKGETYRWLDCDNMNAEAKTLDRVLTFDYTKTADNTRIIDWNGTTEMKARSFVVYASSTVSGVANRLDNITLANGALQKVYIIGNLYNTTTNSFTDTVIGREVTITNKGGVITYTASTSGGRYVNEPSATGFSNLSYKPSLSNFRLSVNTAHNLGHVITETSVATYTATGRYAVEITRANGCKDTSVCMTAIACVKTPPAVTVSGATLSTTAVTGETYRWLDCDNMSIEVKTSDRVLTFDYTKTADNTRIIDWNGTTEMKARSFVVYASSTVSGVANRLDNITLVNGTSQTVYIIGNQYNTTTNSFTDTVIGREVTITNKGGVITYTASTSGGRYVNEPSATGFNNLSYKLGLSNFRLSANTAHNLGYVITEASVPTYTATATGRYSLEVTRANGCKDTSACMTATVCAKIPRMVTKVGAVLSTTPVTGATYRWVDCNNSNAEVPGETSAIFTVTTSGSYAIEVTSNGCVDLSPCTLVCIAPIVTVLGSNLTAPTILDAKYRWLDCGSNKAVISNETRATFTAVANGMYAVELTRPNGCKDTSICIAVTGVGLIENTFASDVKFYPNPTSDNITIELGNNYSGIAVEITNTLGQVITRKRITTVTNHKIVLPIESSSGIYFVRIAAKEGFASFRVVKE